MDERIEQILFSRTTKDVYNIGNDKTINENDGVWSVVRKLKVFCFDGNDFICFKIFQWNNWTKFILLKRNLKEKIVISQKNLYYESVYEQKF